MSSERQISIDIKELKRIRIKCGTCGSEGVYDVTSSRVSVPNCCNFCGQNFGEELRGPLRAYRDLYKAFTNPPTEIKHSVGFILEDKEDEEKA